MGGGGAIVDNRFRIVRKLGEGGFAEVHLAERLDAAGPQVALKILKPPLVDADDFEARVLREVKNARRLDHPNAVHVFENGRLADGRLYYAMEFCPGRSLREVMRQEGPLAADRAVALLRQVLAGLGAAHALAMVHRDVKPDNVRVEARADGSEHARVLDFGLAKINSGTASQELTHAGLVFGTIEYMAPEHLRGQPVDGRADVYATAILLYEMLAGARPFSGPEPDVVHGHLELPPPPLVARCGGRVTPALERAIFVALEKDRARRYATAEAFAAALLAACPGAANPAPGAPARHKDPSQRDIVTAGTPVTATLPPRTGDAAPAIPATRVTPAEPIPPTRASEAAPPAAAPAPPAAEACPACALPLAAGKYFVCAGCERALCAEHYDPELGICFGCGPEADRRGFRCEACAARPAPFPFTCGGCGRVLCGDHFQRAAGACADCAGERAAFACPACGGSDEVGTFACGGCRRTLCARHYVASAARCADCAGPAAEGARAEVLARRYAIVREVGRSSRGRTYEAQDLLAGVRVCLKVLEGPALREEDRRRFVRGAEALRRVVHPNVAQLRDAGALSPSSLYVATDWVEGRPLSEILAGGARLPLARAAAIIDRALAGLEAAHGAGIVHRDVTAAHVLVRAGAGGERARLIGFGIAKAVASDDATVTTWGVAIGTPRYMAPEQLRGRPLDARSDVFAAGVLLYLATAGRVPFDGARTIDVARAILTEPTPPLPPEVAAPTRGRLDPLLARALAKEPAERFPSIADLRRALAAAAAEDAAA
jgi:serine/threonine protein kinase